MSYGHGNGEKFLPARVLQVAGLVLLVGAFVFWAFTGRESALLVSSAMTLILLGAFGGAVNSMRRTNGHSNGNGKKDGRE